MTKLIPQIVPLNFSGERFQSLFKNGLQTVRMKAGHVCLKSGESIGEHVTDKREEIILVLEGEAKITCAGHDALLARANSVAYIPPEMKHNVTNVGKAELRYVYVVAMLFESRD